MTAYKEILRLSSLGISNKKIAVACGCSRTTVVHVLSKSREQGLAWEEVSACSDQELSHRLFPSVAANAGYRMPDYEYVHREMGKSGVTLTLLWLEYCDQCRQSDEIPYKSTQFNKYYHDYVVKNKATMHINHKPGELMEVDWAGTTASIIDTETGGRIPAYIFVAALPCPEWGQAPPKGVSARVARPGTGFYRRQPHSGYAYVEAFFSQDQESWISAHNNAYRFFGGVTRIVAPDNLKTGVEKVGRGEVVINKAYQEMAEHYRTAVIPARVRAPKDKATMEGTVGVISTWILAALRNQQFLSLRELNLAVKEKLLEFLHKPFQKKEGSRADLFSEEKPYLMALASRPYELATWKVATIQYNYHITIGGQNYSVPFEYIKRKVDVRVTRAVIEVFYEGSRICSHPRLGGRLGQYSTVEEHMQGYKSCLALLKLSDKYSPARLEAACSKALFHTSSPSCKGIAAILRSGQDRLENEGTQTTAPSAENFGFTRGADYYRKGGEKC